MFSFRFLIYVFVGGVQWLIDLMVYLLSWPLIGVAGAQALARASGAVAGFYLNRQHTFKAAGTPAQTGRQAFRFAVAWVGNWSLSTLMMLWILDTFGVSEVLAKVSVDLFVVPASFLLMKMWVFAPSDEYRLNQK